MFLNHFAALVTAISTSVSIVSLVDNMHQGNIGDAKVAAAFVGATFCFFVVNIICITLHLKRLIRQEV